MSRIWNLQIHTGTKSQFVDMVARKLLVRDQCWIVTLNLDIFRQLNQKRNSILLNQINQSAAVCLDGFPLVVASKFLGNHRQERVTGADLAFDIALYCERSNIPLFLIGGNQGVSTRASIRLRELFKDLNVSAIEIPYLPIKEIEEILISKLANTPQAFLYVGLGALKSEIIIAKLIPRLTGISFMGCGGALSFISGDLPRCPGFLQSIGLEWLWRLSHEPKRLYKRYIFKGLPALIFLIIVSIKIKIRNHFNKMTSKISR